MQSVSIWTSSASWGKSLNVSSDFADWSQQIQNELKRIAMAVCHLVHFLWRCTHHYAHHPSGCIAGSYSRTPKKERCVQHSDGCGSKLLTLIHGWLISPNSCFPSHTKCLHCDCKWFQSAISRQRPYKDHELEISQIFLQRTILSLALRGWDWIRCSRHANHFLTLVFTSSMQL